MRRLSLSILLCLGLASPVDAGVVAHWIELGPGGSAEVRAVDQEVGGAARCPGVRVDGQRHTMLLRAAASDRYARVCSFALPLGATNVTIAGDRLPAPVAAPQRIVVLGDTGCRIKPPALQNCNDPTAWPFAQLALSAARLRPDLVIHLGDYLYRESACPPDNAGCAGTTWGDNWNTWAADFFTPAAPLLAVAPLLSVRGNHEVCARSGIGYLRILGPGPFDPNAPCADHLPPYAVPAGAINLVVFDDSSAPDTSVAQTLLPGLQGDFARLATIAPPPLWLLMHRPIFGLIKGPLGIPIGGNLTMIEAAGDLRALSPVELMLAGHIHAFEAINYSAHVPPQILAGHGGDNLDVTPSDLRGAAFQGHSGVSVKDGLSVGGFGFLLLTKSTGGWTVDLYKADGLAEGQCLFANARIDCSIATPHNVKTGG
jgi:hypothetical protein